MLASPCSSPSGRLLVHPGTMGTFGGGSTLGGSRHRWEQWAPLGTLGTLGAAGTLGVTGSYGGDRHPWGQQAPSGVTGG